MYNGIGLQTARGSGTNGYVQTNKFFVRPKTGRVAENLKGYEGDQGTAGVSKKANKEILEHDKKRQIELKLVVLEDKLVDQGYTDTEIAEKVEEARKVLVATAAVEDDGGAVVSNDKMSDTQTHQVAARKEKQMETLRVAFGISVSGPDDALELEPGEIKDDKPKGNRKYSRNDEEKESEGLGGKADGKKLEERHKKRKDDYSNSESVSEQEPKVKRRSSSLKDKRRKGGYTISESESEQEAEKKSIIRGRKQKRVKEDMHISKYTDSDSSSEGSSSLDDSSDSDSGPDSRKNVSKPGSKPSRVSRSHIAGNSASGKRASKKYSISDDLSSESDSHARVAKTRKKLPAKKQRHDTDEDESGSADDDTAKTDMRAKKSGSKFIDDDKLKISCIEDEGRWENRNSDREDDGWVRLRYEKYEDDKHKARRKHARVEEREEENRRYGRIDIESPKRARCDDVSPSEERHKDSRRHDRSRH